MNRQNWKKKISRLWFVALLVAIIGCQAVGGFDVNKALVESVVAKSMEGEGEFSLNLVVDEKTSVTPEKLAMLRLFEDTKVKFNSIKIENSTRLSVKGSVLIAKYNIPFEAALTAEQLVLKMDGGKKPIVFDLKGDSSSDSMTPFFTELQTKMSDVELTRSIVSYFIKQLPNPSKLNVETVSDLIHGETVSLHKLHSEITGRELLPITKAFVKNVLKDDQALKELIGQLYDALYPLIGAELDKAIASIPDDDEDYEVDEEDKSVITSPNNGPLDKVKTTMQPILTGIKAVLDDREIAIEVIHTEVKQLFIFALVSLESNFEKSQQALQAIDNEHNYFNMDLYFDNSFKLRKSNTTLMIAPQLQDNGGVSAVRITMSMENWNVNGDVKADSIPTDGGSLTFDKKMKPTDLLLNFDPESATYQLLKKDLGVGKVSFPLY
ncbi:MAG: copper amine oxidase N-terminal protein [Paenibacillus sp.]|jgi:hypothetical protein|nr:copper amine oxidase N-terminal protein [Paenibacillus sp.]